MMRKIPMIKGLIRSAAKKCGVHLSRYDMHPERTLLGLRNQPLDLILDVGANTGQFARAMREIFPSTHIVSFEPTPKAFSDLKNLAQADGNMTAINCALGEENDTLEINLHIDHSPSSSLLPSTEHNLEVFPQTERQEKVAVKVRPLDEIVAELGLSIGANSLLKLDTQGFEERVLRGGAGALEKVGAVISEICLEELYFGQASFANLFRLCDAAGLEYRGNISQVCGADGHVIYLDALFRRCRDG